MPPKNSTSNKKTSASASANRPKTSSRRTSSSTKRTQRKTTNTAKKRGRPRKQDTDMTISTSSSRQPSRSRSRSRYTSSTRSSSRQPSRSRSRSTSRTLPSIRQSSQPVRSNSNKSKSGSRKNRAYMSASMDNQPARKSRDNSMSMSSLEDKFGKMTVMTTQPPDTYKGQKRTSRNRPSGRGAGPAKQIGGYQLFLSHLYYAPEHEGLSRPNRYKSIAHAWHSISDKKHEEINQIAREAGTNWRQLTLKDLNIDTLVKNEFPELYKLELA